MTNEGSTTILIVEDDERIAALQRQQLEQFGYRTHVATTVAKALVELAERSFSAVLLDQSLPDGEGWPVLEAARRREPAVPVIVVVTAGDEETAANALRRGASDCLRKRDEFLARIPHAVERAVSFAQLETTRRESESLCRVITESSSDVIALTDTAGGFLYVSPAVRRLLGLEPERLIGSSFLELVHAEDRDSVNGALERFGAGESSVVSHRWRHRDGSWRWIESSFSVVNWRGEGRIVSVARDISERWQAEQIVRQQSAALAAAANAILLTDRSGTIVWVNDAFTRMTGFALEEAVGQNPRILRSDQHDMVFFTEMWRTILAGEVWRGEVANRRKDGRLFVADMTITPVRDERGRIDQFIAIEQDITDRKQLQAQYLQSQKMEAVGHLAGGVAHDFNNILTGMIGYLYFALAAPIPDSVRRDLDQLRELANHAASLTHQLLAFSRKQTLEPTVINLNQIIDRNVRMLGRLIGENIPILLHLEPALGNVRADPVQVDQVLINLAVNARDAMPNGGQLVIETSNVELTVEYANLREGVVPGPYVLVSVSDTGCGMDEATRHRLFEPFFTTKGPGRGTGLGLATVYGIIKQHGGNIWVYSEPGKGTTFKIYLPRIDEPVTGLLDRPSLPRTSAVPAVTILVAEDDPHVRELARRILEQAGYTVFTASGWKAALELHAHASQPIDLLLTDVVMPDGDGKQLYEEIAHRQPNIKVLYMSGYTDDVISHHGMLEPEVTLLHKPFDNVSLLDKIDAVLHR